MIVACAAPAIVKAENIMKVWVPPEKKIIDQVWTVAETRGGWIYSDWQYKWKLNGNIKRAINHGIQRKNRIQYSKRILRLLSKLQPMRKFCRTNSKPYAPDRVWVQRAQGCYYAEDNQAL